MKRIIHQNIKIILVPCIVATFLLFGSACSKPYVMNKIKAHMSYKDAANARIKQIKKLCKENRVQSVPEQHSLYLMEMGMIEDFVFERTVESEVLYKEAVNKNSANCDARLLLTAKYSEQASKRNPEKIYKGLKVITESVCPKSTLTNFYKAKLNIFEGDSIALTAARKDLEELYVSRLGDTGITKKDILSLIIYAYLKEQNFQEAKIRFEEAANVDILPQVKALMLIGNHDFNKLKELKNNKAVQEFLIRDLDKTLNPPSSIEKVFLKTDVDLKPDETKPGETKTGEYGSTKLERDVAAIIDSSDKDLVKRFLDKRNNNVINLKEKLSRLQRMKTSYLKAAINNALGMAKDNELSKARTDYIRAYKEFDDQAIELAKTLDKLRGINDLRKTVDKPQVIIDDIKFLNDWITVKEKTLDSDDTLLEDILQSYAYEKSKRINITDLYKNLIVVKLDDLSYESNEPVSNVKDILKLKLESH